MGREIRRVPANWKHPARKYNNGDGYEPLREDYIGYLEYWVKDMQQMVKGLKEIKRTGKTVLYDKTYKDPRAYMIYCTEDGQADIPDYKDFMPYGDWYQLYENVSEGTPLSPPFKTKKELVSWLSNNKDYWGHTWTPEQAAAIVGRGYAMSGAMVNGKMYTAEESTLL